MDRKRIAGRSACSSPKAFGGTSLAEGATLHALDECVIRAKWPARWEACWFVTAIGDEYFNGSMTYARYCVEPDRAASPIALGFCLDGMLPSLCAPIGEAVRGLEDEPNLGAIYGLFVSAQSGGSLLAAPLSSLIAPPFGLPAMHLVSAALQKGTGTA